MEKGFDDSTVSSPRTMYTWIENFMSFLVCMIVIEELFIFGHAAIFTDVVERSL